MNLHYLIFFSILLIGCNNSNINNYIEKSNQYRMNKEYGKAIIELKNAQRDNIDDNDLDQVNFLLGEIYLNDIKDYNYAIDEFKQIDKRSDLYSKSIFMIGYIYSNNLNQYSKAINYYEIFIKNFPNHELYPSVEYELDQLSKYQGIIDSLNAIANSKRGVWIYYDY